VKLRSKKLLLKKTEQPAKMIAAKGRALGSIGFNATERKEMSRVTNEPQKILNTAAKAIALH
jgi:hypothetical protein